jgi:hypothetical protein
VCLCVYMYMYIYIHTHTHMVREPQASCMHAYIYICIHAYTHGGLRKFWTTYLKLADDKNTYMRTLIHAYIHTYMHTRMAAHASSGRHILFDTGRSHKYVHTYTYTRMHTHIYAYTDGGFMNGWLTQVLDDIFYLKILLQSNTVEKLLLDRQLDLCVYVYVSMCMYVCMCMCMY